MRKPTLNDPRIRDDSHSDYHQVKKTAQKAMCRGVWTDRFERRFVPFSEREMRSDMSRTMVALISEGKHFMSYRGLPMAKDPLDLVLYDMLFFEVQPRTVIELGTYTGASAMWMADKLRSIDVDGQVYSIDIDLTLIDKQARNYPHVNFLQGDCNRIEEVLPSEWLQGLPHPWVVIDDAHVNIGGVYEHFHRWGLSSGDYLIVEDTIPWIPGSFGKPEEGGEWGDWKWQEIRDFFADHAEQYQVDRYYTDFFGYNATWNWNGFVKRM